MGKKIRRLKIGRLLLALLVLILLTAFLIWATVNGLRGIVIKYTADVQSFRPTTISEQVAIKGVLIKREHLITAPYNGSVSFAISDGQRVKAGSVFAVLTVNSLETSSGTIKHNLIVPASGVLSTHTDGLETVLVPEALDTIAIPALDQIPEDGQESFGQVEKAPNSKNY
ncbi:hypothetical protein N752_05500 [Desulforamulus aquiferis]|nr:HlyD family efflux transporter periplasmic adaptor subunit [Desulforamulus aquiferis]RYD06349.1 hypothetical protein N752_05500 [Desulforamulus aquiferis]